MPEYNSDETIKAITEARLLAREQHAAMEGEAPPSLVHEINALRKQVAYLTEQDRKHEAFYQELRAQLGALTERVNPEYVDQVLGQMVRGRRG